MSTDETVKKPLERLPIDVVPINYMVEIQPDLKLNAFNFQRKLEITAKVVKTTRKVVLNCAEVVISSAQTAARQIARVNYEEEVETVCLEFDSELSIGEVVIFIEYTGTLNDQLRGFYRSKYTVNGEERYLAVTLFELANARRALPCWDEPALKATFDVVLVVPKDRVALSNMNEISCEEVEGNLKRVIFARTPIMSTYLLAFIVGEFDYVEQRDANGVLVRVYTTVGKKEQGQFALDLAVKTLPFYTDYFGTPCPLNKIDLIAIPDFACGAMENWGLVTYREPSLLIDPNHSSVAVEKDIVLVVGHELAHQWFGNLVTMEWWTYLWLNEGFATWMAYLCVDKTHPKFDIWTNFLNLEYAVAMNLDALANSHPIEIPVCTPVEAEETFDVISSRKGACIIRMLCDWIGEEIFRQGLRNYVKEFSYKNAATEDLWAHLAKASGKPVARVMEDWTKKQGYPVLSVEGKQEGDKRVLTISQKKFCADGKIDGFESALWHVPVTIATSTNSTAIKFVLNKHSDAVTVEGVGPDDWILLNPGHQGVYCVSYSADMFSSLLHALQEGSLSSEDRIGLQNDVFALARAGVIGTTAMLRLFASYVNENSYTVWESLTHNLTTLGRLLSSTDYYEDFKKYAVKLFTPTAVRLGWDPKDTDNSTDAMLRSLVICELGRYGHADTIAEAQRRFSDYCYSKHPLPADLNIAIFSTCLANGDSATFDQLVKEKVHSYDTQIIFSSAASAGPRTKEIVWQFIKVKWSVLTQRYPGQNNRIKIIEATTSSFDQDRESIILNDSWLKRENESIKSWLAQTTDN